MIPRDIAKYIKGKDGVVLELMVRGTMGKQLTHDWFRRCCKRNEVSSINTRAWLYEKGIAYSSENMMHLKEAPEFRTYEEWQSKGYQVMEGQTAGMSDIMGRALFHKLQVVDK